ncbi:uncharacterized protein LOC134508228 isoform X3 [Chroicocephalus ridibundus]|uniref:uncharacterized protein LOC134508228 isoform X3 n=1 Tax=Chroicocephalus ridibundus TaxID=1192867 RepID=UPI002FDCAAF9
MTKRCIPCNPEGSLLRHCFMGKDGERSWPHAFPTKPCPPEHFSRNFYAEGAALLKLKITFMEEYYMLIFLRTVWTFVPRWSLGEVLLLLDQKVTLLLWDEQEGTP